MTDEAERRREIMVQLLGETDRAAALIGWALVESSMHDLLNGLMVPGRKISDTFLNAYKLNAICFSLGLLQEIERDQVARLAKIRNRFAHHLESASFADPDIANQITQIPLPDNLRAEESDSKARWTYVMLCVQLWADLRTRIDYINSFPPRPARFPLADMRSFFGGDMDLRVHPAKPPERY